MNSSSSFPELRARLEAACEITPTRRSITPLSRAESAANGARRRTTAVRFAQGGRGQAGSAGRFSKSRRSRPAEQAAHDHRARRNFDRTVARVYATTVRVDEAAAEPSAGKNVTRSGLQLTT